MWVARDKDGCLSLFWDKPIRDKQTEQWLLSDNSTEVNYLREEDCQFKITWEDEPIEVTLESLSEIKDTYKELNKYYLKDFKIRDILHELNIRQDVLAMSKDVKVYLQQITDIIYGKESENN